VNFISFVLAFGCLLSASLLTAQTAMVSSHSVSYYQLHHKVVKQARRFSEAATVELKKQNYRAGITLLRQALEIDPDYWVAENNLGFALLHLQQHEEARKAFQRATEIDPMNPIGYTNLSVAALTQNDFALAEKSASQSIRLAPELPEARAMLGLALVGQGIWTPVARKLLEESSSVPTSETLLKKWPKDNQAGPPVIISASSFR
jgi:Flp pilus assembly protein TadD